MATFVKLGRNASFPFKRTGHTDAGTACKSRCLDISQISWHQDLHVDVRMTDTATPASIMRCTPAFKTHKRIFTPPPALQLLAVLEERQRLYSLDIINTNFSETTYVRMLLMLLQHDFPQAISFRGCKSDVPRWIRQEAYILLSYRLWREGSQRRFVDDENPVELPGNPGADRSDRGTEVARLKFAQQLLDEWLVHCKVRYHAFVFFYVVGCLDMAELGSDSGVCSCGSMSASCSKAGHCPPRPFPLFLTTAGLPL
jgi:hypothetical protein